MNQPREPTNRTTQRNPSNQATTWANHMNQPNEQTKWTQPRESPNEPAKYTNQLKQLIETIKWNDSTKWTNQWNHQSTAKWTNPMNQSNNVKPAKWPLITKRNQPNEGIKWTGQMSQPNETSKWTNQTDWTNSITEWNRQMIQPNDSTKWINQLNQPHENQINQPNELTKRSNYMTQSHEPIEQRRTHQSPKKCTNEVSKSVSQSPSKSEPKVFLSNIPDLKNTFEIIRGLRPLAQSSIYICIYAHIHSINQYIYVHM